MKILSSDQTRKVDQYTIENEPIKSIDLMERASKAFVEKFKELVRDGQHRISIFCGVGNNGGDGLAIARLLKKEGHHVHVYTIGKLEKASADFSANFKRLPKSIDTLHIDSEKDFPLVSDHEIIIDGLFGSGLSRPVEGIYAQLIDHLNSSQAEIISIDIASGLFSDQQTIGKSIIQPNHTISCQVPKLAFFQPSLAQYVGDWHIVDIGLRQEFINGLSSPFCVTTTEEAAGLLPQRPKFSHKGDAGRMLLVAGSKGKMGACVLASKAAFRAGVGLLTVHSPACGQDILQSSIPEAMVLDDPDQKVISKIDFPENTNCISIGPGIGTDSKTAKGLHQLLTSAKRPMVLDADALNILSENKDWLKLIPKESILTPHPGEFKRLVGQWTDDFQRLELLIEFCKKYQLNIVLKGAFSAVCSSSGNIFFNPTGNPGMATAGSGDVLTGIIGALVAQGLEPFNALRLGVYLHGLSGDLAKKELGEISLMASDLIEFLPQAILYLNRFK